MLILAIILVVIAYILYTVSILTEKVKGQIEVWMVIVFGIAFICDLTGTTIMGLIASSKNLGMNLHSSCGYLALLIMAIHFILAIMAIKYRVWTEALFSKCSIYAWIAWSLAFFTGIPK